MKKITLVLGLAFLGLYMSAQNGLQRLVVERYYVSNAADSIGSVGILPVGSVTYRLYADMLPGYNFQLALGNSAHPLSIATTTAFFNNEDRGATTPAFTKTQAAGNTIMLDSWLSVGAACTGNFGVLKTDDNGVSNVVNSNGILKNADPSAGIPLTTQDGFLAGSPQSVTFVGLTTGVNPNDLGVFDGTSNVGNLFTTSNGGWSCLGGATGPNPDTNRVLIAQITTNGNLTFQLNIQIGTPTGGTEMYVYSNPGASEFLLPSLNYPPPIVTEVPAIIAPVSLFQVYPNPTKDLLDLEIQTDKQNSRNYYVIYDMVGNKLLEKQLGAITGKYSEKLDLSSFANGVYLITLYTDGVASTRKAIKFQ